MLALATVLAGLTTATVGCEEPRTCLVSDEPSVTLTIVDSVTGDPVPSPVIITFQLDGGPIRTPEVERENSVFELAYEERGRFEVTVEADGYQTAMAEYEVDGDPCHVLGVYETIELVPSP